MKPSPSLMTLLIGILFVAAGHGQDKPPTLNAPNHVGGQKDERSEEANKAEVKSRVCEWERRIQQLGFMTYSSYKNDHSPVAEWEKKEKLLKNLVNYFENGHREKASFISHLRIGGPGKAVSGPTCVGNVDVGSDAEWSDVQSLLDALPEPAKYANVKKEHGDLSHKFLSELGVYVGGGSGTSGSIPSLEQELKGMLTFQQVVGKIEVDQSSIERVYFFIPNVGKYPVKAGFSNGTLEIPFDASAEEMMTLLRSVSKDEGRTAIEELKTLLGSAKTALAKSVLEKAIQDQEKNNPSIKRDSAKKSADDSKNSLATHAARKPEIDAFSNELKKVAAKLGKDAIIFDETEASPESKALLTHISKLADEGYRLKKGSRTIALTSSWGSGVTQSDSVSGDCKVWTAINPNVDEAVLKTAFEKK